MGVKDLWSILEPARERRSLDSLQGKTVAVDLGIWVCEMQAAIRNPTVLKPHLRNLLFRISALLQRDIKVVVVADGKPPELKRRVMLERQKIRYNRHGNVIIDGDAGGDGKAIGRSKFASHLKECIELLRLLGVSVLESDGEAESTCAAMNAIGVVDAVITDDSDAFLYGARLVIRNFNLEGKEPEADFYCMDVIERRLALSRNKLIALGVVLGSDYCSAGVAGVGKETALKYLNYFGTDDDDLLLPYLKSWNHGDMTFMERISATDVAMFQKLDKAVRLRAASSKDLLIEEVIDEFSREEKLKPISIVWQLPNLVGLEAFFTRRLEWESIYTVAKVVPLITLWQLSNGGDTIAIVAEKIAKTRVRNGRAFYEIQWRKLDYDKWTTDGDFYSTVEKKELVDMALRNLVDDYCSMIGSKQKSKSKKANGVKTKSKPKRSLIKPISLENKENEELADLSATLEKSLVLIEDDDVVDAVSVASAREKPIYTFRKPNASIPMKPMANTVVAPVVEEPIRNDSSPERSEDSPLPLWKRIGMR